MRKWLLGFFLILGLLCTWAEDPTAVPSARDLLVKAILSEGDAQSAWMAGLAQTDNPALVRKTLTAWKEGGVFIHAQADGSKIPFTRDEAGAAIRIDNGQSMAADETTAVETDSRLRKSIGQVLNQLALIDPDPSVRRSAIMKLGMTQRAVNLPILQARLPVEKDGQVQEALQEAIAIIQLQDPDKDVAVTAVKHLVALHSLGSLDLLTKMAADSTLDPDLQKTVKQGVESLNGYLFWVNFYGTIFRGISLSSILLVAALGLAITFGLMGVINMAHGEIIAVGAYSAYVMENLFVRWFGPTGTEWYFLFAIPFAFVASALVGLLLERTIIRFLYNRPLESLLATWGVSLVLQQLFRFIFGAANVNVDSPKWLLGNISISNVTFDYSRLFVIGFAILIIVLTWMFLEKSPWGLLIRAVMQNRNMASCVGVRTQQVNMVTFAFGSGLAGLAGVFLSQIGNVGPNLGQSYIIDCFMTVVVGGVGNLRGTICSAFGIGVSNQTLQQILQNPVIGQITVLIAIIIFLQWKPGGLFPTRGRGLED